MNMLAEQCRKSPVDELPSRLPLIDFGSSKRPGRAIADVQELTTVARRKIQRRADVWLRLWGARFSFHELTWAELNNALLLVRTTFVDTAPTVHDDQEDPHFSSRAAWVAAATPSSGELSDDEWAALGEEIGVAKRDAYATASPEPVTTTEDAAPAEPMIRLTSLAVSGNPMRPRWRAE